MDFVKRSVYQQEFTESGVKESEKDARDEQQKEADRLRDLPEFRSDPSFRSLSQQLEDNRNAEDVDGPPRDSFFAPEARTEEEYEFLNAIEAQKARDHEVLRRDEESQLASFRDAKTQFQTGLIKGAGMKKQSVENCVPPNNVPDGGSDTLGSEGCKASAAPPVHPTAAILVRKRSSRTTKTRSDNTDKVETSSLREAKTKKAADCDSSSPRGGGQSSGKDAVCDDTPETGLVAVPRPTAKSQALEKGSDNKAVTAAPKEATRPLLGYGYGDDSDDSDASEDEKERRDEEDSKKKVRRE